MKKLEGYVRSIPDFPKPGIISQDVASILQDADGLHIAMGSLIDTIKDLDYGLAIGPESRGFVFGIPVAYAQHKGFVPACKKKELPCETISMEYDLEYEQAIIEVHEDTIHPGQKVIIVDDLIATRGTTEAVVRLIEQLDGRVIEICFIMELARLKRRGYPKGYGVDSVIVCEGK